MSKRTGVDADYYRILEGRHDVMVEAGVEAVTAALVAEPKLVRAEALRVEADVPAGADAAQESCVRVFRLHGQSWTQVFCPLHSVGMFELGKSLSRRLETRCLQIDVTDDAWGGHVLFDRGEVREVSVLCVGDDLRRLCPRLGLAVPEMDEDQIYDDVEYFHSVLRPEEEQGELADLARLLGLWVDAGEPVWEAGVEVERLDLLYASD